MNTLKERELSLEADGKESIADRLRKLIGTRTVRAAANDWGLAFSTLNNYLTRGTEPSLNVAIKIANLEGVTAEWIATGVEAGSKGENIQLGQSSSLSAFEIEQDELVSAMWEMALSSINTGQRAAILNLFFKAGSASLSEDVDINAALLNLPIDEKQRLLRLHEQLKKGSLEADRGIAEVDLERKNTKAG